MSRTYRVEVEVPTYLYYFVDADSPGAAAAMVEAGEVERVENASEDTDYDHGRILNVYDVTREAPVTA